LVRGLREEKGVKQTLGVSNAHHTKYATTILCSHHNM